MKIDRPRTTCKFATSFCKANCYNNAVEKCWYWVIDNDKDEQYWQSITGPKLRTELSHKPIRGRRVRLMTRGEAFASASDVRKVADMAKCNPNTLFWVPTRAWRSTSLRPKIKKLMSLYPNLRIMASVDPSTSQYELDGLKIEGWSTMFFGDDSDTKNRVLCPKTWEHKVGHCKTCNICFSSDRVDVHLKQH